MEQLAPKVQRPPKQLLLRQSMDFWHFCTAGNTARDHRDWKAIYRIAGLCGARAGAALQWRASACTQAKRQADVGRLPGRGHRRSSGGLHLRPKVGWGS